MQRTHRIVAVAVAMALAGCTPRARFTTGYEVDRIKLRPEPVNGSLAVKRFEEQRPPRVYTPLGGRLLLLYIPAIPYVSLVFERLDESIRIFEIEETRATEPATTQWTDHDTKTDPEQYTYPVSMARAIADDLGTAGLFKQVVYVGEDSAAGDRYVLTGSLRETPLRRTFTSYALGAPGVLLWLFPGGLGLIPIGRTSAAVTIDLTLTDTNTNSTVWRRSLKSDVSRLTYLGFFGQTGPLIVYQRFQLDAPPRDSRVDPQSLFSWHFEALRRAMNEAKPDLAAALRAQPSAIEIRP